MSKRIVVGLDPSEYSKMAVTLACIRARLFDGTVIGVGIIDKPGIESSSRGAGVGASHYAKRSREHHIKEAEDKISALLAEFTNTCADHEVACETVLRQGSPAEILADEALAADLVIIGTRTFFHFETQRSHGDTLNHLLKCQACPIMVIPRDLEMPIRRVIIPYDGSRKSALAMRSFVSLTHTLPVALDVLLLTVDEDVELKLADLEKPAKYLRAYGYQVEAKVVPGDAREVIREVAKVNMPTIVVLGASEKSDLRVFLFGGVTQTLLDDSTIPLYVAS
jgi:nucleotide-binding universal stress UspA family protein